MAMILQCDADGCTFSVQWEGSLPVGWFEVHWVDDHSSAAIESALKGFPVFGPIVGQMAVPKQQHVSYLCPLHRPVRLKDEPPPPSDEQVKAGPPGGPPEWVGEMLKAEMEKDGGEKK